MYIQRIQGSVLEYWPVGTGGDIPAYAFMAWCLIKHDDWFIKMINLSVLV